MREIDLESGLQFALDALHGDRLALLCGAGLSRPSGLPSAAQLASAAKRKYDGLYGATRPPLAESIDDQAEFFFRRDELATVYLRSFVDPHAFSGPPNQGHMAVADLLLVGGIHTAASTNVDDLIETAGNMLHGNIAIGIDDVTMAQALPYAPALLKLHGCWKRDPSNTIWAKGQLSREPVHGRIEGSRRWLSVALLNRDLIVVGFFTDWEYLNAVIDQLSAAFSRRVSSWWIPTRVLGYPQRLPVFTPSAREHQTLST